MESIREFFSNRRNLISAGILIFIALALPLGLFLLQQVQTYRSSAAGELIQLAEGPCIQTIGGKKSAICTTIPLKLISPFTGASPSPISTASAGASPSVGASPTSSASAAVSPTANPSAGNCPTTASNGTELLAAISCYKAAAGTNRRLTLSAGTFEVTKKISVPHDLTIVGAGMNSTVIKMATTFDRQTSPSDSGDDALMANDSSAGQQNIVLKDFSLQGDGQRSGNSCCYGLKLQNLSDSFVINVNSSNWGIDGIFMGMRPNKPGANRIRITGCVVNNNGRNGIAISDGQNNVIDNCQLSGNSANELVSAIDLEPDNGNIVSYNHVFNNTINNNRNNGISILQNPNDPGGEVYENHICDNNFSGNSGTNFDDRGSSTSTSGCSINGLNLPTAFVIEQSQNLASNLVQKVNQIYQAITKSLISFVTPSPVLAAAGFSAVQSNGCGSIISTPIANSAEGNIVYKAPSRNASGTEWQTVKPDGTILTQAQILAGVSADTRVTNPQSTITSTFINCDLFIAYSENGSCTIDAPPKGREGVNGGKLAPGEQVTIHVKSNTTPNSPGCRIQMQTETNAVAASPSPSAVASPITGPSGNAYRLAETQAGLVQAQWVTFTTSPIVANFTISSTPGPKQVWVEYKNAAGQTLTDHTAAFDLLAPSPVVSAVNCTLDVINKNVKVTVTGTNLGAQNGTLTVGNGSADIVSWSDTSVTGLLKNAATTGDKYSVIVKRADTLQSTAQSCQVNTSAISIGARVFCREAGKFDVSNVKISFFSPDAPTQKIDEVATIDKDGLLQGLKTKLAAGTPYVVSMKAPYSLRRNAPFTVYEGTSVINAPDGKPFILPIGDISPAEGDGQINTLDRAELVKQWRVLPNASASATQVLTGDFNRDSRVNSIDWACMKYDFNSSDDAADSAGSTYTRGTGNFNSGQNSAIFTLQ